MPANQCFHMHNEHELEVNVKSALDAFEVEKKSLKVTNFWTEIQNLEEEKKCSHWGTSAYSGKRLLNMQMDKFAK
ncbi:unnamed protein product [Rhizophagus irregularis]|nr:unnamed protein product [Rhizophagus irregularis]